METGADFIKYVQTNQNAATKSTSLSQQNVNRVETNFVCNIDLKIINITPIDQSALEHACTAAGYSSIG